MRRERGGVAATIKHRSMQAAGAITTPFLLLVKLRSAIRVRPPANSHRHVTTPPQQAHAPTGCPSRWSARCPRGRCATARSCACSCGRSVRWQRKRLKKRSMQTQEGGGGGGGGSSSSSSSIISSSSSSAPALRDVVVVLWIRFEGDLPPAVDALEVEPE